MTSIGIVMFGYTALILTIIVIVAYAWHIGAAHAEEHDNDPAG